MSRARRLPSAALVVAILAVVYGACGSKLRSDEFLCEEAYVHLQQCCPGFQTDGNYCTYDPGCGTQQFPALDDQESECIRRLSCDQLVSSGVCGRAQERHVAVSGHDFMGNDVSRGRTPSVVCP